MPLGIVFSFVPTVGNMFELCVRVAAGTATSHYGWGCGHQWCGCFKGSWWQNTTLFNLKALASGTHSAPFEPQKTLFKRKKAKRKGKKNWTKLVFWLQGHFSDFAATNTGWRLLKNSTGRLMPSHKAKEFVRRSRKLCLASHCRDTQWLYHVHPQPHHTLFFF